MRVVAALGLVSALAAATPARRVVDGRDAAPGELPFIVSFGSLTTLVFINTTELELPPTPGDCTGSAISPTWVLTARHCMGSSPLPGKGMRIIRQLFKKINNETYTMRLKTIILYGFSQGENNEKKSYSTVLKTVYLPDVTGELIIFNDIALCHTEPILIARFARVSALPYSTLYGQAASIAGFGLMRETEQKFNYALKLNRTLQVIDKGMLRSCDRRESDLCVFPSMRLAAMCGERKVYLLFGDSGSPVLHATGVVGVVSGGVPYQVLNPASNKIIIQVIIPTSVYIDWIIKTIKDNN